MKPRSFSRFCAPFIIVLALLVGCAPPGGSMSGNSAAAPAAAEEPVAAAPATALDEEAAPPAEPAASVAEPALTNLSVENGDRIVSGKILRAKSGSWAGADTVVDEVLVYGDQAQIDRIMANFPVVEVGERTALAFLDPAWETRLYQISDGSDASQLAEQITTEARQSGVTVNAEPNLVMVSNWQGGHVFGSRGAPPRQGPNEGFLTQWLWGKQGIALPDDQPWRGQGVTVGIFDNCPLAQPGWVDEMNNSFGIQPGVGDVEEHGASIASLIDQMAPDAKLKLYCVLDPSGYGRLSALLAGLATFIDQHPPTDGRSVINLSLGVSGDVTQIGNNPTGLLSLTLDAAYKLGFVNVAAAGNQGNNSAMNHPAAYASVISVAGSTEERLPSDFSNLGEIGAPAGGNWGGEEATAEACIEEPGRFVITRADSSPTSHLCWLGTSFAAPLVSGAVALLLAKDPAMTTDEVAAKLYDTAEAGAPVFGAGILNVTQALQ